MSGRDGARRERSRSRPRTPVTVRDEGAGTNHPRTPDPGVSIKPSTQQAAYPPTHPPTQPPTIEAPTPPTHHASSRSMPPLAPFAYATTDVGLPPPAGPYPRRPSDEEAIYRTPEARAVTTHVTGAPAAEPIGVPSPAGRAAAPPRQNETPQRCRPVARDTARPRRSPSAPPRMDLEMSPRSTLHSDMLVVAELQRRGVLSQSLMAHIAMYLNDLDRDLDRAQTGADPTITATVQAGAREVMDTAPPPLTPVRRPRLSDGATDETTTKRLRTQPLPSRDPRITRRTETAPAPTAGPTVPPPAATYPPSPMTADRPATAADDSRATTTFADALRTARQSPTVQTGPTAAPQEGAQAPPKPKFPPLIVEEFPNWTAHFRALKDKLGHAPNARPLGKGMRFTPGSVEEYRIIQRYLCELEKTERLSWFSYALPSELSKKVAIRGLPATTTPAEIIEALGEQGFQAEYVRPIRARMGRPGCVFFAVIANSPDVVPGIYGITELLYMPGIKIEAWRAKRGPAQCHRCQAFRHSSHGCHRRLACVRCGGEHPARDCQRPLEEPATCANCGGPHPANHTACPQYKHEARNKRAGTVALSQPKAARRQTVQPSAPVAINMVATDSQATTLMAPANPPTERGVRRKKRGKGKQAKRSDTPAAVAHPSSAPPATRPTESTRTRNEARNRNFEAAPTSVAKAQPTATTDATPAAQPLPASQRSNLAIDRALDTLKEVLLALREGRDPVQTVLDVMMKLVTNG